MEETSVVVVINEDTEGRDVFEVLSLLSVAVSDAGHRLAASEHI